MNISVFTSATRPEERQDPYDEAIKNYLRIADELIVVGEDWPEEFDWPYIGETFQDGFDICTGDWVIRMDLDYFFHERDIDGIIQALKQYPDAPAITFWKYQFLLADRYTLKARLPIAFNKKKFPDMKLNGGGDLCQPTIDGKELDFNSLPEARIPFYNYDFTFKEKHVVQKDFPRFARAWGKHFGAYDVGGPDDESAFDYFMEMQLGRFNNRGHELIALEDHPEDIQDRIYKLQPKHFGYSMWGNVEEITYA